jgi:hypothetical protein
MISQEEYLKRLREEKAAGKICGMAVYCMCEWHTNIVERACPMCDTPPVSDEELLAAHGLEFVSCEGTIHVGTESGIPA